MTPVQLFVFVRDAHKPGRILSTAKIGDVYMSRLIIQPGVTTGNYYHKKTKKMFYVEKGKVLGSFENVKTKEKRQIMLLPGKHVVHVPPYVAHATKNIGTRQAILVFFSNKALRSTGDTFSHPVL